MKLSSTLFLITALAWTSPLSAQESESSEDEAKTLAALPVLNLEFTYEVFSLPMMEVAKLKRKTSSGAVFYQEIVKKVAEKKGVQEEFLVMRMQPGGKGEIEEITEHIYPTEYEPPEIGRVPDHLPADFDQLEMFISPAIPSAFDTKNLGSSIEAESTFDNKRPDKVHVKLAASHVQVLGSESWGEGISTVSMPRFSVQKLNVGAEFTLGSPTLLGTVTPRQVNQKKDQPKQIWLAFVTVSVPKL